MAEEEKELHADEIAKLRAENSVLKDMVKDGIKKEIESKKEDE